MLNHGSNSGKRPPEAILKNLYIYIFWHQLAHLDDQNVQYEVF